MGGTPPPGYPGYAAAPGAQPPRRRSMTRVIVIVVVVILVIGLLVFLFYPVSTPTVNITVINFVSSDNACGLNGETASGFSTNVSQPVDLEFSMMNFNSTPGECTVHTIGTNTTGFSITGASPLPLVIPANATENWNFTVNVPGSSYTGVLTVIVT
jgi:hypothetical protein